MDKVDQLFLQSFGQPTSSQSAYGKDFPDQDLNINQRVARFLMLLRDLDECTGGLDGLPVAELSEMVSSALGVCGFVDPEETRSVIATVLEVIERTDSIPEISSLGSGPVPPN
jgi:hypothetical protein